MDFWQFLAFKIILSRYYATYYVLVWSYDGLYDDDPVTAFAIWSALLAWIYAHPMWLFRMIVVILQKWLLIGTREAKTWEETTKTENHGKPSEELRKALDFEAKKLDAETGGKLCEVSPTNPSPQPMGISTRTSSSSSSSQPKQTLRVKFGTPTMRSFSPCRQAISGNREMMS